MTIQAISTQLKKGADYVCDAIDAHPKIAAGTALAALTAGAVYFNPSLLATQNCGKFFCERTLLGKTIDAIMYVASFAGITLE